MSAYEYTALDPKGKTQKGLLESDSARQVRQILRDKQWVPLSVEAISSSKSEAAISKSNLRIRSQDLVLITRQLSTLIASGLPVDESIKAAAEQSEKKKVMRLLLDVRARVLEGNSLAVAMNDYPKAFPLLYTSTVAAGEQSGHLDLVLERLADYVEARHESRQKIQLAMLYPLILFVLSLLIVSGLLVYVVPKVVTVFSDTGQDLPMLTTALINLSSFMSSYGPYLLLLLIVLWFAFRALMQNTQAQFFRDRLKLKLPLFAKLGRGLDTARFVSTLSILNSSGITLVDSMKIAVEVIENQFIKLRVKGAIQHVIEGASLRSSLANTDCFPPMMLHMIGSGEASGELDKMLDKTSHNQQKELENYITVLVRLFEPMMLVVMGVVVMTIVLAILLPILNLNQLVG